MKESTIPKKKIIGKKLKSALKSMLEKKKYILPTFQNTNQSMKKQVTLLMISKGQG